MQVSIIIINFNVKYFLEQCLSSVIRSCENVDAEIIVVDNNSTDDSKEFFSGRFKEVIFIWNKENAGFSKANNLALKKASGRYILFLNPDTILPEDCMEKCLSFFDGIKVPCALGIRMVDGSGNFLKESKRAFPALLTAAFKLSGLTALFPSSRLLARYYLGHLDQHTNHEVDVLAGAFMMVDRRVLDKTGGFDERFFMYGEDVDLSYRIQQAGFKNYYFSQTTIIHFKGESTHRGSADHTRLFYGAMKLFVQKYNSRGSARLYSLLVQGAIKTRALFSGISYGLNRVYRKTKNEPAGQSCLVVSDEDEFKYILSILERNNIADTIRGRVSKGLVAEAGALGNLQQLSLLVRSCQAKEIIFCANKLPAKEIIRLIGFLPRGLRFSFHFAGTVSIVGSGNSKSTGSYIALDNRKEL